MEVSYLLGLESSYCSLNHPSDTQQRVWRQDTQDWVLGQADFSFTMPINKLVGCAALCGDQTYPDPTPSEGFGRQPLAFE